MCYYYCCFDVVLMETDYRSYRIDFLRFRREGLWVGRWSISQAIDNSAGIPNDGYAMKVYMLQELSFVHPIVLSITCLSRPLLLIHRIPAFEMLSVLLHECACLQASLLPYSSNIARHPTSGSARGLRIYPLESCPIKEGRRDLGCSDWECLQRVCTANFNYEISNCYITSTSDNPRRLLACIYGLPGMRVIVRVCRHCFRHLACTFGRACVCKDCVGRMAPALKFPTETFKNP
ncbi:hypothetical protein BGX38DRAFT_704772 [Terfezia claveryi]|nr:hypothetical protein BGX38DRAFT_704772 [Terfezia claveryi]